MRTTSMRVLIALAVSVSAIMAVEYDVGAQSDAARRAASREWPTYGHNSDATRFSPLTEITPANAGDLKVAWVYHMRPAPTDGRGATPAVTAPTPQVVPPSVTRHQKPPVAGGVG